MRGNIVEKEKVLTLRDLAWKPYYRNNATCNGQAGFYCIISMPDGSFPRKYTIFFQHKEVTGHEGHGLIAGWSPVDRYILFEKVYLDGQAPDYPSPKPQVTSEELLRLEEINDFGSFLFAYTSMKLAKKRALYQYQSVQKYALSR